MTQKLKFKEFLDCNYKRKNLGWNWSVELNLANFITIFMLKLFGLHLKTEVCYLFSMVETLISHFRTVTLTSLVHLDHFQEFQLALQLSQWRMLLHLRENAAPTEDAAWSSEKLYKWLDTIYCLVTWDSYIHHSGLLSISPRFTIIYKLVLLVHLICMLISFCLFLVILQSKLNMPLQLLTIQQFDFNFRFIITFVEIVFIFHYCVKMMQHILCFFMVINGIALCLSSILRPQPFLHISIPNACSRL